MTDISRVFKTIECLIQYYRITPSDIVIQLSSTVGDKRNHYIFTRIRWSRERSRSRSRPIRTRRAARALTVTASGRPCRRRRVWRSQTVKMPATCKHPCVRVHGRVWARGMGFGQRDGGETDWTNLMMSNSDILWWSHRSGTNYLPIPEIYRGYRARLRSHLSTFLWITLAIRSFPSTLYM